MSSQCFAWPHHSYTPLPCSQHTNQRKPSCSRMQPLPPAVLSLQLWALGRSALCSSAGMGAGCPGLVPACLGWEGKELVMSSG